MSQAATLARASTELQGAHFKPEPGASGGGHLVPRRALHLQLQWQSRPRASGASPWRWPPTTLPVPGGNVSVFGGSASLARRQPHWASLSGAATQFEPAPANQPPHYSGQSDRQRAEQHYHHYYYHHRANPERADQYGEQYRGEQDDDDDDEQDDDEQDDDEHDDDEEAERREAAESQASDEFAPLVGAANNQRQPRGRLLLAEHSNASRRNLRSGAQLDANFYHTGSSSIADDAASGGPGASHLRTAMRAPVNLQRRPPEIIGLEATSCAGDERTFKLGQELASAPKSQQVIFDAAAGANNLGTKIMSNTNPIQLHAGGQRTALKLVGCCAPQQHQHQLPPAPPQRQLVHAKSTPHPHQHYNLHQQQHQSPANCRWNSATTTTSTATNSSSPASMGLAQVAANQYSVQLECQSEQESDCSCSHTNNSADCITVSGHSVAASQANASLHMAADNISYHRPLSGAASVSAAPRPAPAPPLVRHNTYTADSATISDGDPRYLAGEAQQQRPQAAPLQHQVRAPGAARHHARQSVSFRRAAGEGAEEQRPQPEQQSQIQRHPEKRRQRNSPGAAGPQQQHYVATYPPLVPLVGAPMPLLHAPSHGLPVQALRQQQQHLLDAAGFVIPPPPPPVLSHRTNSPWMRISSIILTPIGMVIILFIVVSPLLHYLM